MILAGKSSSLSRENRVEALSLVPWSALPPVDVYEGSGKARTDIFSTKYTDQESGLVYYGLNTMDSRTGRWLSRDGMGEDACVNLYASVFNDAVNYFDYLGLNSMKLTL